MTFERLPFTVTARALTEPWDWTTASGDPVRAKAGDYRITDDATGRQWSITAEALQRGYRHLGGASYHSHGEETAVRVPPGPSVAVATTEGPEIASAGEWIVTDLQGHTWVIDDDWFAARYRRLASTASTTAPSAASALPTSSGSNHQGTLGTTEISSDRSS